MRPFSNNFEILVSSSAIEKEILFHSNYKLHKLIVNFVQCYSYILSSPRSVLFFMALVFHKADQTLFLKYQPTFARQIAQLAAR